MRPSQGGKRRRQGRRRRHLHHQGSLRSGPECHGYLHRDGQGVDHDLSAVIWDADSQSWFSTFNTKTIPNYKKLTEQASRQQIMAAATDTAGITYAASYEEKDGNLYSTLYQVGKDYSLTKIGDSEVAYTDMTFAEKLNGGTMLATCGKSIVTVDTATGAYTAGWNLSTLFSANLVGITYLNTVNDTTNGVTDNCLVLDADGKVWAMASTATATTALHAAAARCRPRHHGEQSLLLLHRDRRCLPLCHDPERLAVRAGRPRPQDRRGCRPRQLQCGRLARCRPENGPRDDRHLRIHLLRHGKH